MINYDRYSEEHSVERIGEAFDLLSGKWEPQIVFLLAESDPMSFSQLQQELDGISNKVLAEKLEKLKNEGLIRKRNSKYSATGEGEGLLPAFRELAFWVRKNREKGSQVLVMGSEDLASAFEDLTAPDLSVTSHSKIEVLEEHELAFVDLAGRDEFGREQMERLGEADSRKVALIERGSEVDEGFFDSEVTKPITSSKIEAEVQHVRDRIESTRRSGKKAVIDRSDLEKLRELESKIEELEDVEGLSSLDDF